MSEHLSRLVLQQLTTAHVCDGCLRARIELRCAPYSIRAQLHPCRVMGRARPVRHCGGTDAILEALDRSSPGEVLVIDNDGRTDEACVGDLIALRAKLAGLAGIVIWGQHRDTAELHDIGLPVFSMGAFPARSQRVEAPGAESLVAARVGAWNITTTDLVMGDNDGVIFLPGARLEEIAVASAAVCDRETVQREGLLSGRQS